MGDLIYTIGSFIQYIYDGITQVMDFVIDLFVFLARSIVQFKTIIGVVCPTEIAFVVAPILVSMFAFLGIKLLVRLL